MKTTLIRETREAGLLTRVLVEYERKEHVFDLMLESDGKRVGTLCFDHQDALWLQAALSEAMFAQNTSPPDVGHLVPLEDPEKEGAGDVVTQYAKSKGEA